MKLAPDVQEAIADLQRRGWTITSHWNCKTFIFLATKFADGDLHSFVARDKSEWDAVQSVSLKCKQKDVFKE